MRLIRLTIVIYLLGFLAMAGVRYYWPGARAIAPAIPNFELVQSDFSYGKRNIASKKRLAAGAPSPVDQKYEQIASQSARTENFEEDEESIRGIIRDFDALIQYEQRSGLEGYRRLQLAIGVHPDNFDQMLKRLQTIGKLTRLQIDKTDKTNEYLDLQARKTGLEKSRDALIELKQRDGKIDELVSLERQILELEQQIQGLGVSLGDFDAENEFSTIKLNLNEVRPSIAKTSVLKKIASALFWTLKFYSLLWIGLAACLFVIYLAMRMLQAILNLAQKIEST